MSNAAEISRVRRGSHLGGNRWLTTCPCAGLHPRRKGCGGPSLIVSDTKGGVAVRCEFGCPEKAILKALILAGLVDAPSGRRIEIEHHPDPEAIRFWKESKSIENCVARDYIRAIGFQGRIPAILRWRPHGQYRNPQILAGVAAPNGEIIAVQVLIVDRVLPVLAPIERNAFTVGALGAGAVRLAEPKGAAVTIYTTIEEGLLALDRGEVPWVSLVPSRAHRIRVPQAAQGDLFARVAS